MSNSIECVITIRAEDSATEDEGQPKAASGSGGEEVSAGGGKSKKAVAAVAAYGYAKRAINTVWDYQVSTISLRTGQERLQERQETAKKYISYGFSLVESAVAGFLVSGNPVGAVVGVAVNVVSKGIEMGLEASRFNLSRAVEDVSLTQANIRAGCGGGRIGRNST